MNPEKISILWQRYARLFFDSWGGGSPLKPVSILDRRLYKSGHCFEWADIKRDLKVLQETVIEDHGKSLAVRTECIGTCGKTFQAVGVAIPATIREL